MKQDLALLVLIALCLFLSSKPAWTQEIPLLAATASVDMTPPVGVPLARYGGGDRRIKRFLDWGDKYRYATFFTPSVGVIDPVRSKVFLLQRGKRKLLFISLDLTGTTSRFVLQLVKKVKKLGIRPEDIFVSGTHTHSGPGTLTKRIALSLIAVDRDQNKIYDHVFNKVLESIYLAHDRLAPVVLYHTTYTSYGIQKNRRKKIGHFDSETHVLLARALDGHWLGGMFNLAAHGTALGSKNLKYSADLPGALEQAFEALLVKKNKNNMDYAPTILFMNGSEADVKPKYGSHKGMMDLSALFAEQVEKAMANLRKIKPEWKTRSKRIFVGVPNLNIKTCVKQKNHTQVYLEWPGHPTGQLDASEDLYLPGDDW